MSFIFWSMPYQLFQSLGERERQDLTQHIDLLNDLIQALTILPGVGRKSAQRMAYKLMRSNKEKTLKILDKILNDEKPKAGSYRGRVNNEPENNRKTLMDIKNA